MTVSVAMTTYNGELYIRDQLESILNQSRLPDEVVIFDDCSNDRTVEIIKDFISKYSLSNWHLHVNQRNHGWKANFGKAIQKTKGDLVFLSDQDDIWNRDKIERMSEIMKMREQILVLASNYRPLYQTGKARRAPRQTLHGIKRKASLSKVDFGKNILYVLRPGCTYCFRRSFWAEVSSGWSPNQSHDGFLWRRALILDGLFIYNTPTIVFRRHDTNSSARKDRTRAAKIDEINIHISTIRSLIDFADRVNLESKEEKKDYLRRVLLFLNLREKCYTERSFILWLKLAISFRKDYSSFGSLIGDLCYLFRRE